MSKADMSASEERVEPYNLEALAVLRDISCHTIVQQSHRRSAEEGMVKGWRQQTLAHVFDNSNAPEKSRQRSSMYDFNTESAREQDRIHSNTI